MTAERVARGLKNLLEDMSYFDEDDRYTTGEILDLLGFKADGVKTFDEAMLMTDNEGLVVDTEGGDSFQVTVIRRGGW